MTFTFVNNCQETVWLGISGSPVLQNNGLILSAGQSTSIEASDGWMGRFWGRTGCTFNSAGVGYCETGDCGGVLECGRSGTPPASLAEFNIQTVRDFYDVSLVDGYNLEISVSPSGGTGNCSTAGCIFDLNTICPPELQEISNGTVVACKSACDAFNQPQYCCTGPYGSPKTCKPTSYSQIFKRACPRAYSYAYDDPSSTFTCTGANYTLTFC